MTGSIFISRGDESGTHVKEKSLWQKAGIKAGGVWYLEIGQGMGAVLTMAMKSRAIRFVTGPPILTRKTQLKLQVIVEGDPDLLNYYSAIQVNPCPLSRGQVRPCAPVDRMALYSGRADTHRPVQCGRQQIVYSDRAAPGSDSLSDLGNAMNEAISLILSGDREMTDGCAASLRFSLSSTLLAAAIGIPAGIALASSRMRFKRIIEDILNTLLAMPTVVVGLFVYTLIFSQGPLGNLRLLFSPTAIILGQTVLILPLIAALSCSAVSLIQPSCARPP